MALHATSQDSCVLGSQTSLSEVTASKKEAFLEPTDGSLKQAFK